jgi:hypothetical protein
MKIIRIGSCAECPHVFDGTPYEYDWCGHPKIGNREIVDLDAMPNWCPLEDAEEAKNGNV